MIILGLNTWFHDTSACLVVDGRLVVALEEERFSRDKHTRAFPEHAVARCLEHAGLTANDVDHVAVSIDPTRRWGAKTLYALRAPHRAAPFVRHELINGLMKQRRLRRWLAETWPGGKAPPLHFVEHHRAHAAGSFFVSPYEEAAILSLDGSGEWASAWLGHGTGARATKLVESEFPHSLGSVYEAVTEFCGFRPNYDEGKTMGLAPLGDPDRFIDEARRTVRVDGDGRLHVDLSFFDYQYWGHRRCGPKFVDTFGTPRTFGGEFAPHHADVAAAFQLRLEECALEMASVLRKATQARHLVVAGGVALNSVMNGRLLREAGFEDLYVMPAAGDGGTAIGAAYCVLHDALGASRDVLSPAARAGTDPTDVSTADALGADPDAGAEATNAYAGVHDDPFVGNAHADEDIERLLLRAKIDHVRSDDVARDTAALLERGLIVGWFQGRMEIGPRALGARSILANPAFPDMKDKINAEVKLREAYRPFAPSATVEAARTFFDLEVEAPFMLKVCQVREEHRAALPAITHVDGSARLQTVRRETAPLYHALITELGRRTGVPVVLNTSFNIQGEPVVESPVDAIRCFFSTGLDALAIGPFVVTKRAADRAQLAGTRPPGDEGDGVRVDEVA